MSASLLSILKSVLPLSDEQAMWRLQMHDDPDAMAHLMRRWQGPIHSLCTRMTGDSHRGEDLAQETFARVFSRRKNYQASGRFSTYIWRVAVNLCYDELRRLRRRSEVTLDGERDVDLLDLCATDEVTPAAQTLDRERADLVRQAVLRLSEAHRSVIILRHYEGLKFREIAEVLDIPEGTVKSRMAEALSQLHRFLTPALPELEAGRKAVHPKRREATFVL